MRERSAFPFEIYVRGTYCYDDVHTYGGIGGYTFIITRDDKVLTTQNRECLHHVGPASIELIAVANALEYIEKHKQFWEEVIIYTQSPVIVKCYLKEWWRTWEMNGWMTAAGESVANKMTWLRILPFLKKRTYSFNFPPKGEENLTYKLCCQHARETSEQAKLNYYKQKREQANGMG